MSPLLVPGQSGGLGSGVLRGVVAVGHGRAGSCDKEASGAERGDLGQLHPGTGPTVVHPSTRRQVSQLPV